MEIRSFGVGRRMRECEKVLATSLGGYTGRLILLPIPTTRDNIYINSTDRTVDSVIPFIDSSTTLVGYKIPDILITYARKVGAPVLDLSEDESFLAENSRISAVGAIGYMLTNRSTEPSGMTVGVIGYGRIGRELVRLLLLLGADVRVYTSRPSVAFELGESGIRASAINHSELFELDLLINTAPARLISVSELPPELDVLDLASGSIFDSGERLIKLSSIPEAFYPISAGKIYAEAVMRFLEGVS